MCDFKLKDIKKGGLTQDIAEDVKSIRDKGEPGKVNL